MKKLTAALLLTTILFSVSCKKPEGDSIKIENLAGTWIWQSTTGGIAGIIKTPASTGKNIILTLKSNHQYEISISSTVIIDTLVIKDTPVIKGTYQLVSKKNMNNENKTFIIFQSQYTNLGALPNSLKNFMPIKEKFIEQFNNNTLILEDNGYDMYTHIYHKLPYLNK